MKQLRIGVSCCFFHPDFPRPVFIGKTLVYYEQSILKNITLHNHLPVLIPPASNSIKLENYTDQIDALVLQGGSDVAPESYGEEPLDSEWKGDRIRDIYEIELLEICLKKNIPVLAVCRGLQLANVALGGTLYQDIETQLKTPVEHRNPEKYDALFHEVEIEKESFLFDIYNTHSATTNSIHHQCIKELGKNLIPIAYSKEDKIIEAFDYKNPQNKRQILWGIQWHPEFQDDRFPNLLSGKSLFEAFFYKTLSEKENSK